MEERPACPRCPHEKVIKFGLVKENQRWQCKSCQYRFTRTTPRGKAPALKALAIALHGLGLSFNAIGTLLCVSAQAVIDWVRKHTQALPRLELDEPVHVVEMDEMWHFLDKKTTKSGSGRHMLLVQIDSSTGKSVVAVQKH